jgi:hypothetical protein
MAANQTYIGHEYGSVSSKDDRRSTDASKHLLLSEYESLLRIKEPVRILNRLIVITLVVVQSVNAPLPIFRTVVFLLATTVASCFWFLQEFLADRRLVRIGELIAATSAELGTGIEATHTSTVTLPPKREFDSAGTSQSPTASAVESVSRPSYSADSWTDAYINWQREAWANRGLRKLQRSEPIAWFLLALVVAAYRLMFTYR